MSSPVKIDSLEELLASMNISAYQKHPDFHIFRVYDHLHDLPQKLNLRSTNFFEITFSQSHGSQLNIDEENISTNSDHVFFLSPGQTFFVDSTKSEEINDIYILFFTAKFVDFATSSYNIIRRFPFFNMDSLSVFYTDKKLSNLYLDYMQRIYREFQSLNSDSIEIIKSLLTIVLFETKRNLENNPSFVPLKNSRKQEVTYHFENLIKRTEKKYQKIKFFADRLNVSPVYLSECVKEITGKTAKSILNEYVLLEAKHQLLNTPHTVERIAIDLGFSDKSNFISFYKKYMALTPNQERKKAIQLNSNPALRFDNK